VRDARHKAAVIGASGFIGGELLRALSGDGVQCIGYTRSTPFLTDSGELDPGLADTEAIFWLASSIRPATASGSDAAGADLDALAALLTQLDENARHSVRVLAVSSGGTIYDTGNPPPYSEASPLRPANAYGEAMLAMERLLRDRWPNHVVLRASNAYGPGQPARRGQGVIAHWFESVLREQPIRMIGDPDTRRDYLYIDDLVEALRSAAAITDPADGAQIINVASGVGTSLRELAEAVERQAGRPVEIEQSQARTFDAPSNWLSVSLAEKVLGWHPTTSLETGLAATWRSLTK
jgi:UDP-glucose 4-epimerase